LTRGRREKLTHLGVQSCVRLRGARGSPGQTPKKRLPAPPSAACRSDDGKRWVITAWHPPHRTWDNPRCPCLHSDPKFPDCAPGETKRLRGGLWFHEGADVKAELRRLDKTGWRKGK